MEEINLLLDTLGKKIRLEGLCNIPEIQHPIVFKKGFSDPRLSLSDYIGEDVSAIPLGDCLLCGEELVIVPNLYLPRKDIKILQGQTNPYKVFTIYIKRSLQYWINENP